MRHYTVCGVSDDPEDDRIFFTTPDGRRAYRRGIFWLYRAYGPEDELLYVGITCQQPPSKRIDQHDDKAWYKHLRRLHWTTIPTRQRNTAELYERMVIQTERPAYNVMLNAGWNY